MLGEKEIRHLAKMDVIRDFVDLEKQIQPSGFDLTLKDVMVFPPEPEGELDFSNKKRKLAEVFPATFFNDETIIKKGIFGFVCNEFFDMPEDLSGIVLPRSSLNRGGNSLNSAIIDPGYSGRLFFLVNVNYKLTVHRNARFAQIVFFRLKEKSKKLYDGIYKEAYDDGKPK